MSSYRIVITEIKPVSVPVETAAPAETKVFEQVVENLSLSKLIKQINATPRVRRRKNAAPDA